MLFSLRCGAPGKANGCVSGRLKLTQLSSNPNQLLHWGKRSRRKTAAGTQDFTWPWWLMLLMKAVLVLVFGQHLVGIREGLWSAWKCGALILDCHSSQYAGQHGKSHCLQVTLESAPDSCTYTAQCPPHTWSWLQCDLPVPASAPANMGMQHSYRYPGSSLMRQGISGRININKGHKSAVMCTSLPSYIYVYWLRAWCGCRLPRDPPPKLRPLESISQTTRSVLICTRAFVLEHLLEARTHTHTGAHTGGHTGA